MRLNSLVKPLAASIVLASSAYSSVGWAQGLILEEVIVTSQLRTESLMDVPVSVSAVSGDKLREAGIDKIEDLQAYVPNLTMSETGIGTNIYIRGIGSGINQGFEQSTGMYVDGVSYGRAQLSRAPFLDLERVEVLRGPQNILFGKNSIAGALSIVTAKPTDEFEGSVSVLYEPEHGEEVLDLVLSGPLTDDIGARFAYRNKTMDGYIDNITLDKEEPNRDEETLRLSFDWALNENVDMTLKVEHSEFNVTGRQIEIIGEEPSATSGFTYGQILFGLFGADASVLNNTADFKRSSNGDYSDNETDNVTFTLNYALGENELTFITGFLQYEYEELCDCDFTGANIFSVLSEEDYEQFSQEIRFVTPVGETVEYIGGVYFQTSELDFKDTTFIDSGSILPTVLNVNPALGLGTNPGNQIANNIVPRLFTTDTDLFSAFIQATWNIEDNLRFTLAGRYSSEEKDGSRSLDFADIDTGASLPLNFGTPLTAGAWGVDAVYALALRVERHDVESSRDESAFSPMLRVEYDLNSETLLYVSATQGTKSGGYDARSNVGPGTSAFGNVGSFEFEDEEATSFEGGAKLTLMDGAAELNAAFFYTEYSDLQVSIFDGLLGFVVGNAGEAETYGLELDGRWRITENITLIGALAFLDFEFTDFENGQCNFGETPDNGANCDSTGETNQYVADWSGSFSADYFTSVGDGLEFRSTLDFVFTDDYNPSQSLDPVLAQDGYVKVNARISLADSDDTWEVALVGKNLTDEEIVSYANKSPLTVESSLNVSSSYAFYERDRSIAIQGVYRF